MKKLISTILILIVFLTIDACAFAETENIAPAENNVGPDINYGTLDEVANGETYQNGTSTDYANAVITTNNGTVTDNFGTVTTNNGITTANMGEVTTNNGTVTTNNGTTTANMGEVTTNNGTVTKNLAGVIDDITFIGTVTTNSTNGKINTNYAIVETNKGEVETNMGVVDTNDGTVVFNYNQIEANNGEVKTNSSFVKTNNEKGTVWFNYSQNRDAYIEENDGIVSTNHGTIGDNKGTVKANQEIINVNEGTVEENTGEIGTINYNINNGIVEINEATVKENYAKVNQNNETVEINGGEIEKNNGTVEINLGEVTMTDSNAAVVEKNAGVVIDGKIDETTGKIINGSDKIYGITYYDSDTFRIQEIDKVGINSINMDAIYNNYSVVENTKIIIKNAEEANAHKDGYRLIKWANNFENDKEYNFGDEVDVTLPLALKAVWEKIESEYTGYYQYEYAETTDKSSKNEFTIECNKDDVVEISYNGAVLVEGVDYEIIETEDGIVIRLLKAFLDKVNDENPTVTIRINGIDFRVRNIVK